MTTTETTVAPAADDAKRVRKLTYRRTCQECGTVFRHWHADANFCTRAHGTAFHNRSAKRGKVLIPILLTWRGKRGSGDLAKYAFAEMCAAADLWNAEDRKAGRPPMYPMIQRKKGAGWKAVDLARMLAPAGEE
jgi:hypothetical protein